MNRMKFYMAVAALTSSGPALSAVLQVPQQFNTIQDAVVASQDGDTIQLGAGVYNVPVDYLGKDIVLQGAGMDFTVLSGSQSNGSVVRMTNGEGTSAELSDLTIEFGNAVKGGGLLLDGASPEGIASPQHDFLALPTVAGRKLADCRGLPTSVHTHHQDD